MLNYQRLTLQPQSPQSNMEHGTKQGRISRASPALWALQAAFMALAKDGFKSPGWSDSSPNSWRGKAFLRWVRWCTLDRISHRNLKIETFKNIEDIIEYQFYDKLTWHVEPWLVAQDGTTNSSSTVLTSVLLGLNKSIVVPPKFYDYL